MNSVSYDNLRNAFFALCQAYDKRTRECESMRDRHRESNQSVQQRSNDMQHDYEVRLQHLGDIEKRN
ncbi:MAG: hypothetical protein GY696_20260 [Gammaproteobacteria bacterium]|nr:hypothetical protein [Gammaproteobacteria bacterium]